MMYSTFLLSLVVKTELFSKSFFLATMLVMGQAVMSVSEIEYLRQNKGNLDKVLISLMSCLFMLTILLQMFL